MKNQKYWDMLKQILDLSQNYNMCNDLEKENTKKEVNRLMDLIMDRLDSISDIKKELKLYIFANHQHFDLDPESCVGFKDGYPYVESLELEKFVDKIFKNKK